MDKEIEKALQNLYLDHIYGLCSILFVQPDINKLTPEDILIAYRIAHNLTGELNFGVEYKKGKNKTNDRILEMVDEAQKNKLDEETYFEKIFNKFGLKQ